MARSKKAGRADRGDPTPAEIRAMCAEIQAGWSKAEEYRRRAFPHLENTSSVRPPYELPQTTARLFAEGS